MGAFLENAFLCIDLFLSRETALYCASDRLVFSLLLALPQTSDCFTVALCSEGQQELSLKMQM